MLLGRDRELATLLDVCAAAVNGNGSVTIVRGEPGVGKTALLAAVASATSLRVLRAVGAEAERAVPFATVQQLLWPLREMLSELSEGQELLLRSVLGVDVRVGSVSATSLPGEGATFRIVLPWFAGSDSREPNSSRGANG